MLKQLSTVLVAASAVTLGVAAYSATNSDHPSCGSCSASTGFASATIPASAEVAQAPSLIALGFHADWCPGCKAMGPKLESVMRDTAKKPCLFVKLDQTDKDSKQAEYLVASLGLADVWKENGGKTGFALLVDPKSKKVVGRLSADQDAAAMTAEIEKALGAKK